MIKQWELATRYIIVDVSVQAFTFISKHVFYAETIPRSVMGVYKAHR